MFCKSFLNIRSKSYVIFINFFAVKNIVRIHYLLVVNPDLSGFYQLNYRRNWLLIVA